MLSERSSVWGARVGGPPTDSRGARVLMNIEHRPPEARQSTPGGSKRIANNDFLIFATFFRGPRPALGGSWELLGWLLALLGGSWAALRELWGGFGPGRGREFQKPFILECLQIDRKAN